MADREQDPVERIDRGVRRLRDAVADLWEADADLDEEHEALGEALVTFLTTFEERLTKGYHEWSPAGGDRYVTSPLGALQKALDEARQ